MADRNAFTQPQGGPQGFARTMKCFGDDIALLTTDLALNRTVGLYVIPKGFVLTSLSVVVPDLDTNGAPALVFHIGDAADPDRLIAAATTGQAGGTNTTLAATGLNYEFTEDTLILWTTATAAATAAAGTIKPRFFGFMK